MLGRFVRCPLCCGGILSASSPQLHPPVQHQQPCLHWVGVSWEHCEGGMACFSREDLQWRPIKKPTVNTSTPRSRGLDIPDSYTSVLSGMFLYSRWACESPWFATFSCSNGLVRPCLPSAATTAAPSTAAATRPSSVARTVLAACRRRRWGFSLGAGFLGVCARRSGVLPNREVVAVQ